MSTMTADGPSGVSSAALSPVRGGVRVREEVIDKVVREASAATIGVRREDVAVDVAEWAGGLAVRIMAKMPIPDLADTDAIRDGESILERIRRMQSALAEEFSWLTGREIRRVSFTVTGAIIPARKSVK